MSRADTKASVRRLKAAARSCHQPLKAYARWAIRTDGLDPTLRSDARRWAERKGLKVSP